MLIDCPAAAERLAAQRYEDLAKAPDRARLVTRCIEAVGEVCSELVASELDHVVTDDYPALKHQFFSVAQAQLKATMSARSAS